MCYSTALFLNKWVTCHIQECRVFKNKQCCQKNSQFVSCEVGKCTTKVALQWRYGSAYRLTLEYLKTSFVGMKTYLESPRIEP